MTDKLRPSAFALSMSPALQARVLRAYAEQIERCDEYLPLDIFASLVELVDDDTLDALDVSDVVPQHAARTLERLE